MQNRLPVNLLRQEISGTTIYLEILHKSTSNELNGVSSEGLEEEKNLKGLAEEKLVSFCGNVLREASDLQPNTVEAAGSTTGADIHRVLDLRAPIIVKVQFFLCQCI
jgi:guanine nucleotide-exchange factor